MKNGTQLNPAFYSNVIKNKYLQASGNGAVGPTKAKESQNMISN